MQMHVLGKESGARTVHVPITWRFLLLYNFIIVDEFKRHTEYIHADITIYTLIQSHTHTHTSLHTFIQYLVNCKRFVYAWAVAVAPVTQK